MASTTVEFVDRPDIAENLLMSDVVGDSGSATAAGHAIRSANFSVDVRSAASLSNRCLAILSCRGKLRTTLVAFVGDTISSSRTSSAVLSVDRKSVV